MCTYFKSTDHSFSSKVRVHTVLWTTANLSLLSDNVVHKNVLKDRFIDPLNVTFHYSGDPNSELVLYSNVLK